MSVKVSIVIPYYNHASFLRECLVSVHDQVYQDWDAIVVDDASQQNCEKIVEALGDKRIQIVHHKYNKGLAAARNTGITHTKTPWVLPLDADDRLSPHFLSQAMNVVSQNPAVDAIFTDHLYFGDFSYVKNRYIQTIEEVLDHHSIPGAGTLYKRQLWEKVGGYCEAPVFRAGNEDWDFWLSVYEAGFLPFHIPEPLYEYRRYQGSMVNRLQIVDYKVRWLMYRRHSLLFDKHTKGKHFLSMGFENSAIAAMKQKKPLLAGMLAACGFVLNANNKKLARLAMNSWISVLRWKKFPGRTE